jgi:hypothetical protein
MRHAFAEPLRQRLRPPAEAAIARRRQGYGSGGFTQVMSPSPPIAIEGFCDEARMKGGFYLKIKEKK